MLTKNGSEAVRRAGYSPNNAAIMANKLLRKPLIKAEIDRLKAEELGAITAKVEEHRTALTKDVFIDKAMKDYEALPVDHANRMRALDLAGRGAGIIGKDGNTTTNNTMIVNVDAKSLPAGERWDRLRQLIDGS